MKIVERMLDAYESVKSNLNCHAPGYPLVKTLRQCVHLGIGVFGESLGDGFGEEKYNSNPGVQCILNALEKEDSRPLWVGLWGGANTLAQALWQISRTKNSEETKRLLSRLRIHAISDHDNSAKWIRQNFGSDLFYIVTPSNGTTAGTKEYCRAVWPGISADTNGHGSEDGIHGGGFSGKLSRDNAPSTTVTFSSAGTYHLILQVTGARKFPLRRYQRIVFEVSDEIKWDFR